MNSIDTVRERMEAVEIFEIPGLFSVKRIDRAAIPKGCTPMTCKPQRRTGASPAGLPAKSQRGTLALYSPPARFRCRRADSARQALTTLSRANKRSG